MKTYVVFVLGPWHTTPKTLGISWVIGVPFITTQELLFVHFQVYGNKVPKSVTP